MLTSISVRDFQSLAEVDLELGPLTVIVGPGNSGKTAVVRALKALAFNRTGSDFIRHGQQQSVVIVETAEGGCIAWVKGKAAAYMVGDRELTKMAGSVPEEVSDVLGIRRLEVEAGSQAVPQIHSQFDSPFLIAESPSKAARVVAKLTRLDVIVSAQTQAARDLKRTVGELKAQRTALEEAQTAHATAVAEEKQAQSLARQVTALYDAAVTAGEDLANAEAAVDVVKQAQALATRSLPDPTAFEEVEALLTLCEEGARVSARYSNYVTIVKTAADSLKETARQLKTVEAALADIDVCPLCGARINEEACCEVS